MIHNCVYDTWESLCHESTIHTWFRPLSPLLGAEWLECLRPLQLGHLVPALHCVNWPPATHRHTVIQRCMLEIKLYVQWLICTGLHNNSRLWHQTICLTLICVVLWNHVIKGPINIKFAVFYQTFYKDPWVWSQTKMPDCMNPHNFMSRKIFAWPVISNLKFCLKLS